MLADYYFWIKSVHVMAIISWMAGLFYLPRLFVYHVERGQDAALSSVFVIMQNKLLKVIMTPAMIVAWATGVLMASTPGMIAWSSAWVWVKLAGILGMTAFHFWCAAQTREFEQGGDRLTGKGYRMMNEIPTLFMVAIVVSVIVKF